ncbi:MAG: DUF418 domain-containing protein [Bacteroidota bacterium]
MMQQRIIGFDLARAYAILGMYIVNFNIVFGGKGTTPVSQFLALFSGNSSTVFVMLAGMGVALMTSRLTEYDQQDRTRLRSVINKRACFLFLLGLSLYLWWPADILHFYGGYMFIASFFLFLDKKIYLWVASFTVVVFHLLLLLIPYEKGWNFDTLEYADFWTIPGFLRNTLYNGWNPIFPWLAYFIIGLYLGRLNWTDLRTQKRMFFIGLSIFAVISVSQFISNRITIDQGLHFFINADYLPPFLPFLLSTTGFGIMLIASFMFLGKYVEDRTLFRDLAKTGQMTLTHYISHLTVGMLLFAWMTGKKYSDPSTVKQSISPVGILSFSIAYFILSFYFSRLWTKKFKNGPFEILMRKISG